MVGVVSYWLLSFTRVERIEFQVNSIVLFSLGVLVLGIWVPGFGFWN